MFKWEKNFPPLITKLSFSQEIMIQNHPSCPGISPYDSNCPSKKVYRHNNWPIGLLSSRAIYQPADCVPGTPTTNNPTCPADDGKLYVKNGLSYKVYCDLVLLMWLTLRHVRIYVPLSLRVKMQRIVHLIKDKILGPNYKGTPLPGAIVLAKQ
ncbi:hypothetical protein PENARI_c009G12511 [Penicillium arizonense]|uniref:Uncharacterized protein n=1 Tax=Penicillium arizonense TaxID=1835702 RepID=A0A1F5LHI6_PENAI|nr:hypothetical protein PENARI_c009G12511 [Penicillium arizonense]OGE52693.1 hypothetical protein PENARI_c009G12511 [Penicillium arizonense]